MINAPQNPGYFPMQPGVREIQPASFAFGAAGQAPSFTGAQQYNAQSAETPTVQGPSLPGFEAQSLSAPTVQAAQAAPFQAQQGSVGQIQPGFSPSQFNAQQISANYTPQGGPQIGELPQTSYQAQSVGAPSVGAAQANAQMFDMDSFRPFKDAMLSEATRSLDPMFADREAAFRQRMVAQGIQEGTDAYDRAFANFSRERNDAYSSARNQALA